MTTQETAAPAAPTTDRLATIVLGAGLAPAEHVEAAAERARKAGTWLGSELVEQGLVAPHDLSLALCRATGVQMVDLVSYPVDLDCVKQLPQEVSTRLNLIPLSVMGSRLFVAMANPLDTEALAEVAEITELTPEPLIATQREINSAIARMYAQAERAQAQGPAASAVAGEQARELLHADELLEILVARKGSDLHLSVGSPPVIRVHGGLVPLSYEVLTPAKTQEIIYAIISDDNVIRFERTRELDFAYSLAGVARFRVNVHRQRGSVGAVFRVVPMQPPTLTELAMPDVLRALTKKPRGLILVTGPTGHGKSTTLAAMTHEINRTRSCHIVTIEDPIEFLHRNNRSLIIQREVGEDTESFQIALRHVLRQDPDVILIGEMRDLETIAAAVTAAETGHLVFATLHTTSAPQTIDRIIDVFPPHQQQQIRLQLSTVLEAIVCQALLPQKGGHGRVCAQEIMIATSAIRNLIRESKSHQIPSVMQSGGQYGMQTLDQCLCNMVSKGTITREDALAVCHDPDELQAFLNER
jgi:twitching motility protein PilT